MKFNYGRMILASLISSVVIFFFGFIYWTMIPAPAWANQTIPSEKLEAVNLSLATLELGTYVSPGPQPNSGETMEDFSTRVNKGPVFKLNVDPDGLSMPDMKGLAEGFLHSWIAAFMVAVLLTMTAPALCSFGKRLCFVILVGAFASFWVQVGDTIWWFQSCGSTTWYMVYDISAWILAGFVLAAMIKAPVKKEGGT